jgi:hypothetical protein
VSGNEERDVIWDDEEDTDITKLTRREVVDALVNSWDGDLECSDYHAADDVIKTVEFVEMRDQNAIYRITYKGKEGDGLVSVGPGYFLGLVHYDSLEAVYLCE